jgi:hypothetical protein
MTMQAGWIKPFFFVAGLYDAVLGLAFLFFARDIFAAFAVTPPNHPAYVQFPALLLIVFGAMFFSIAANPAKNRDLIWYGMGLKAAYCGSVFFHQLAGGVPFMWQPWAWADLAFLVLFFVAWKSLAGAPASA